MKINRLLLPKWRTRRFIYRSALMVTFSVFCNAAYVAYADKFLPAVATVDGGSISVASADKFTTGQYVATVE